MKIFRTTILALLTVTVLAACSDSSSDTTSASAEVSIAQFAFTPRTVTVAAGTEIIWENTDRILHTVTSGAPDEADGRFSGTLDGAGTTFSVTLEPGTYDYFCARHPHMVGSITVGE